MALAVARVLAAGWVVLFEWDFAAEGATMVDVTAVSAAQRAFKGRLHFPAQTSSPSTTTSFDARTCHA